MADSKSPIEPNMSYHIYNHAVGKENLFNSARNYQFFLSKLEKYLSKYINIYSYCLLPNHFHLHITAKDEVSIMKAFEKDYPKKLNKENTETSKIISSQFSHLFNSYAQAFNKENNRKGSLFYNRFKRKLIDSEKYFIKLIHYIHFNPVHHRITNSIEEWPFSSYHIFFSKNETMIKKEQVLEIYGDIENFKYCHTLPPEISGIDDL